VTRLRILLPAAASIVVLVALAALGASSAGAWRAPKVKHGHLRSNGKSHTKSHAKSHAKPGRTVTTHKSRPAPVRTSSKSGTVVREATPSPAVTIAKVLATPCENTQLTPEAGNLALIDAAVLCLINTKRAENGDVPLTPNAHLEQAAEGHGKEMIADNYFDHVSPSGLTPVARIKSTGYVPNGEVGYVIGENLAWGTLSLATPQAIVSAWIASPGHLANILEGKYRDTGINVLPEAPASLAEGSPGGLYTQEFGVIVH
jgi:uncharacterized protein YkwD